MFRWLWLCVCAFALCGCVESRAEFDALNLGKVNALYENGALKIMPTRHCEGECLKQSATNSSLRDDSHESSKQSNSSLRESQSDSWQSTDSNTQSNQKDNAPFALFFFTTTCGVCKAQIPILQEIASESASSGARIYAILGNVPNKQKAMEYVSANAMSLPLFYESEAKRFFSQIVGGVKGVPVVVVFDKEGRVKERFVGLTPKSVLKSAL